MAKASKPEKRGKKPATTAPAHPAGGPWLNRQEAATYIGLACKTLDNWRATRDPRRPKAYIISTKVLYKQADLDAWLAQQIEQE